VRQNKELKLTKPSIMELRSLTPVFGRQSRKRREERRADGTVKSLLVRCAVGIGLIAASVGTLYAWSYSSLVRRSPRAIADLPSYGDELRSLDIYSDSPSCDDANGGVESYRGPGWYPRRSPNGERVAVTTSWGAGAPNVILGLLIDRPFYHTVGVWDARAGRITPIVSIKEADPHSGIAHRYAWSRDSRALLIVGSGRLPDDYDAVVELCLVYLPAADQLYRLSRCPPFWQRSVERRQPCWETSGRTRG